MTKSPLRACIQLETGFDGNRRFHRLVLNGQDVGLQVRSIDLHAEGDQPAEVRVTFVHPDMTVEGFVDVIGDDLNEEADRG